VSPQLERVRRPLQTTIGASQLFCGDIDTRWSIIAIELRPAEIPAVVGVEIEVTL
jgi:hypothetical protein